MAPIVKSLPSYIKDSQHALEIFRGFNFLGQDKLIFTMDISSLYTVIPNSEGLLALKYFFDIRIWKVWNLMLILISNSQRMEKKSPCKSANYFEGI